MPGLFDPQPPQGQGLFGNLGAGLESFAHSNALLPALANMFSGFASGQRMDPQGQQMQAQEATYKSLLAAGAPEHVARAAALNPREFGQYAQPYLDVAPKVQFIPNEYGGQTPFITRGGAHPSVEEAKVGGGGESVTSSGGMGDLLGRIQDMRNAGAQPEEMIAVLPKTLQGYIQGMLEGRALPSSLGFKAPIRQSVNLIAQAMGLDEAAVKARMKFANEYADSSISKFGGMRRTLNALAGHWQQAANDIEALHNLSAGPLGGLPLSTAVMTGINKIGNSKEKNLEATNQAQNSLNVAIGETAKYLGSGRPTDTLRAELNAPFDINQPPSGFAGSLRSVLQKIQEQRLSQEFDRDTAMGKDNPKFPVMSPAAEKAFANLEQTIAKLEGKKSTAPTANPGARPPLSSFFK